MPTKKSAEFEEKAKPSVKSTTKKVAEKKKT